MRGGAAMSDSICGFRDSYLSAEAIGTREKNEALGVQHSGRDTPLSQGLSPLSSACLYLRTQTSTPCAMFAKSLLSTFPCKYSINQRHVGRGGNGRLREEGGRQ